MKVGRVRVFVTYLLVFALGCLSCCCPAIAAETRVSTPFAWWTDTGGKPPEIVLVLVHGFGLHKGAFDGFAKRMQKEGIASYALDIRGFGAWRTEDEKSQKVGFDQGLLDIGSTLIYMRNMHPGVPVVLIGESMGGAFALTACASYPDLVDGLVASVPSQEFFGKNKTALKALVQAFRPDSKIHVARDLLNRATEKESLRKKWEDDPHARFDVSPKELLKFELFVRETSKKAALITEKPVLMLHGSRDRLARQEGSMDLFNKLVTKDKELVIVGSEHLLLELGEFDEKTVSIILDWLKRHYKSQRP